ncbi:MAG: cytochrome c [Nitrospirae bacterium]|nr:cytochrome c [Nitrospirota bacterium]
MKRYSFVILALVVSVSFFISSCATGIKQAEEAPVDNTLKIIEGGKLYDQWWVVVKGAEEPKLNHPLWSLQSMNKRSGSDTWRCKECHGWDYLGNEGAYSSGSHKTGFAGVLQISKMSVKDIEAILLGSNNPFHNFSYVMDYDAINNLALFLKEGLIDDRVYIDSKTKAPFNADPKNGKVLYEKMCLKCHGSDGTELNFGTDQSPEYVGTIAVSNPWELVHKIRFGQPGSIMPALRLRLKLSEKENKMPSGIETGYTMQDVMDIVRYSQTLPK